MANLEFGSTPHIQDTVTVVGYPTGGETISVTKGVVSRVELISYAHAASKLLGNSWILRLMINLFINIFP